MANKLFTHANYACKLQIKKSRRNYSDGLMPAPSPLPLGGVLFIWGGQRNASGTPPRGRWRGLLQRDMNPTAFIDELCVRQMVSDVR